MKEAPPLYLTSGTSPIGCVSSSPIGQRASCARLPGQASFPLSSLYNALANEFMFIFHKANSVLGVLQYLPWNQVQMPQILPIFKEPVLSHTSAHELLCPFCR